MAVGRERGEAGATAPDRRVTDHVAFRCMKRAHESMEGLMDEVNARGERQEKD